MRRGGVGYIIDSKAILVIGVADIGTFVLGIRPMICQALRATRKSIHVKDHQTKPHTRGHIHLRWHNQHLVDSQDQRRR